MLRPPWPRRDKVARSALPDEPDQGSVAFGKVLADCAVDGGLEGFLDGADVELLDSGWVLHIDGARRAFDVHFADGLPIDRLEANSQEAGAVAADAFEEPGHQPVLVGIGVLLADGLIVGVETEDRAVVRDSNDHRPAVPVPDRTTPLTNHPP